MRGVYSEVGAYSRIYGMSVQFSQTFILHNFLADTSRGGPAIADWGDFYGPHPFEPRPSVHFLIKYATKGSQKTMQAELI